MLCLQGKDESPSSSSNEKQLSTFTTDLHLSSLQFITIQKSKGMSCWQLTSQLLDQRREPVSEEFEGQSKCGIRTSLPGGMIAVVRSVVAVCELMMIMSHGNVTHSSTSSKSLYIPSLPYCNYTQYHRATVWPCIRKTSRSQRHRLPKYSSCCCDKPVL